MALRVVIGQGLADLDSVSVAGSCRRRLAVGVCVCFGSFLDLCWVAQWGWCL